jgi:hypothetical protein
MRNLTLISWENGRDNGNKLFKNFKNTVFDINHADYYQKCPKNYIF